MHCPFRLNDVNLKPFQRQSDFHSFAGPTRSPFPPEPPLPWDAGSAASTTPALPPPPPPAVQANQTPTPSQQTVSTAMSSPVHGDPGWSGFGQIGQSWNSQPPMTISQASNMRTFQPSNDLQLMPGQCSQSQLQASPMPLQSNQMLNHMPPNMTMHQQPHQQTAWNMPQAIPVQQIHLSSSTNIPFLQQPAPLPCMPCQSQVQGQMQAQILQHPGHYPGHHPAQPSQIHWQSAPSLAPAAACTSGLLLQNNQNSAYPCQNPCMEPQQVQPHVPAIAMPPSQSGVHRERSRSAGRRQDEGKQQPSSLQTGGEHV